MPAPSNASSAAPAMARRALAGVFAPPPTPFTPSGEADGARLAALAHRLLAAGCDGLCPFGSTGEGPSLGLAERRDVLSRLVDEGVPPARLVPGVGLPALPDLIRLCRHAVELGCAGVLMLPPYYYRDAPDDGLAAFVEALIHGVADDRLRIVLYHIPATAGLGWSLTLVERLAARYPGVVIGIKDSSGHRRRLVTLAEIRPPFAVMTGAERNLSELLEAGGAGTISAMANLAPGRLRAVVDGFHAGSPGAEARQARADAPRQLLADLGLAAIPSLKALLAGRLGDRAWAAARLPLRALDDVDARRLMTAWTAAGFADEDPFGA